MPSRNLCALLSSLRWPLLLLGLIVLYFGPTLAEGRLLAPGDGIAQNFPLRVLAFDTLRMGELPFWNPFAFSGIPLLAVIHVGVFFPGNWAFLALPPVPAMNVTVIGALWLAGCGAFALGRAIGMPGLAAAVTGTVFMLSGYWAFNMEAISMMHAAGMAPWLLWAVERFHRTGRRRYPLLGCWFVALSILAGHPQMTAYSMLLVGAYALWRGFGLERAARWRFYLPLAFMGVIGIGLSLPQLLPTMDLIQASQRQHVPYERLVRGSIEWLSLPSLLAPFMFGTHVTDGWLKAPVWAPRDWMMVQLGYVGVATWVLALLGLARARRDAQARFWGVATGVLFLLALGGHTPLYRLWALLPVVNQMQYANRHLMLFTLAIAVLAGLGLAELGRRRLALAALPVGASLAVLGVAVAVFGPTFAARTAPLLPPGNHLEQALRLENPAFWLPIAFWLAATALLAMRLRRDRPLWRGAIGALVAADLLLYGAYMGRFHAGPVVPPGYGEPPRYPLAAGRTLAIADERYPYMADFSTLRALHYPGPAVFEGTRLVNGYDAFILAGYRRLYGMGSDGYVAADALIWNPAFRGLDLLALSEVRLTPAAAAQPAWQARLGTGRWQVQEAGDEVVVLRNRHALPYVWRAAQATSMSFDDQLARVASAAGFDPAAEALVERPLAAPPTPGSATARLLSPNRIRLETDGPGPGLVVVSEGYDPGWRAASNGRPLPVHRVDGVIMGVEVPPGRHTISLTYEPRRWRAGLAGGLVSALLFAWWAALGFRRVRP